MTRIFLFILLSYSVVLHAQKMNGVKMNGVEVGNTFAYDFTGITGALFLGNSIMDGNLATAGNSFRELLTTQYSWSPAQNLSVGGKGVWRECFELNNSTFTRTVTVLMEEGGLNDIRRSHSVQTFNKIKSGLDVIIARTFIKTSVGAVASGSSSVTRSGSFTSFDANSFGGLWPSGALPGNYACYNTTANATWAWSFTGDNLIIAFSGSYPSINRGVAEIRVDGGLVDTITDFNQQWDGVSDGTNDNQRGPVTKVYWGLGAGSHSVEVKALSASPDVVVIDYFSVLDDPSNLGVVLLIEVPKVLDYAKPGLDQANDSYIDQVNSIKILIADKWSSHGYKISYVPIMPTYYLSSGVTIDASDGVHPTNSGHSLIRDAINEFINY